VLCLFVLHTLRALEPFFYLDLRQGQQGASNHCLETKAAHNTETSSIRCIRKFNLPCFLPSVENSGTVQKRVRQGKTFLNFQASTLQTYAWGGEHELKAYCVLRVPLSCFPKHDCRVYDLRCIFFMQREHMRIFSSSIYLSHGLLAQRHQSIWLANFVHDFTVLHFP